MNTIDIVKLLDEVTLEREEIYKEVLGSLTRHHVSLMSSFFFELKKKAVGKDISNQELRVLAVFAANKAFRSCCDQICSETRF